MDLKKKCIEGLRYHFGNTVKEIYKDIVLEDNVKIGNFVEVKNSIVGRNTKINHLSYVGDCEIGENCNIGCGAVFTHNGVSGLMDASDKKDELYRELMKLYLSLDEK